MHIYIYLFLEFRRNISTDLEARTALDHFIATALLIRDQPGFESSIFHKLDLLLSNVDSYVRNHFESVRNNDGILINGTFIALAAPSMEGKTQSAFVFRRVKPLYFPISGLRSAGVLPQHIYKNFAHLADAFLRYASLDLEKIRSLKLSINVPKVNEFDDVLRNCEFCTLGFLCQLVVDGRTISENDWMRHHAERPDFEFQARSIRSIADGFFDGFFLFLDEYVGNDAGLFIRNLARVSKLTCIVANTNSRISNLTKGLTSGGSGVSIWSLVACRLNAPENYSDIYNFNDTLGQISLRGKSDQRIDRFILDFERNQAKHLRPGVSKFLKQGFLQLNDFLSLNPGCELNIKIFMDKIVESLQKFLERRKPSLVNEDMSHWAKIGLLFPTSFDFSNLSNLSSDDRNFHLPCFLEYHLYHLVNPTDFNDWLFMTFAPQNNRTELMVNPSGRVEWSNQFTHFKGEELFTILGCLWFPFNEPVTAILKKARRNNITDPSSICDMPNDNAIKLPGNILEISAAVSLIDASHHFFDRRGGVADSSQLNTFAGQNGIDFIKNIIVNMIDDVSFKKALDISIIISHQVLVDFLALCHIPYLYSINRRIEILDSISDSESSVFFESFTRPNDSNQVDGFFKFKFASNDAVMTAECKNRKEKMSSNILENILRKSLRNSAKVCLIFCNKFTDKAANRSKFMEFCISQYINVYRIRRDANGLRNVRSYLVEQFSNAIFDSPQSICILFESRRINALAPPKEF